METPALAFGVGDCREHSGEGGLIRSVTRALKLLALINTRYACSLHELHQMSGLPKPTVFRILATLHSEGYVEFEGRAGIYCVGEKVRELSAGYSREAMLVDLCRPILLSATQQIKWPLALGMLDGLEMVVRYSTMPQSPMAVHNSTQGHRHGLLGSAMGAAYLAFCPDEERELLLELSFEEADQQIDRHRILRRIDNSRIRGYGLRLPEKDNDGATAALPLRFGDSLIGVLSLTTFSSVMSEAFVRGLLDKLDEVVGNIERAYQMRLSAPPNAVSLLSQREAGPLAFRSSK